MSALSAFNQAILNTILARLALLFLTAAGDPEQARQAAADALAGYDAQTEEELRLAAEIISFGFHALEALAQATEPDHSANRVLRLRGSAVSLSREAHKSQRKLDQLQRIRRTLTQQSPAKAETEGLLQAPAPETQAGQDPARAIADAESLAKQINAGGGVKRWSPAGQKRALAMRMAEKARQDQLRHAASLAGATPSAPVAQG
jgi:hypothetical protein